jgi:hypothetical protein
MFLEADPMIGRPENCDAWDPDGPATTVPTGAAIRADLPTQLDKLAFREPRHSVVN